LTLEEVVAWFNARRKPSLPEAEVVTLLASAHPRTAFLKTLPFSACVLDLGADNGGLEVLRKWPTPARADLRLYAYAERKGEHFDAYDGFELGTWAPGGPSFPQLQFDAIVCARMLPYVADPIPLLEWAAGRLNAGGRLYLEWPSAFSTLLPQKSALAAKGVELMISNLRDDGEHKVAHDRTKIVSTLSKAGFLIEQQGYVSLPFLEQEILAHVGEGMRDAYALQCAFWSKTRWSQYVVALRKP
jgi:SAM-dependent methyltransferase